GRACLPLLEVLAYFLAVVDIRQVRPLFGSLRSGNSGARRVEDAQVCRQRRVGRKVRLCRKHIAQIRSQGVFKIEWSKPEQLVDGLLNAAHAAMAMREKA